MSGIFSKKNRVEARADEGDHIIETLRLFENPSIHWEYTEGQRWSMFRHFGFEASIAINRKYHLGDASLNSTNIIMEELLNLFFETDGWPDFPRNAYERLLSPINARHRHIEYFHGNPGFSEKQTVEVGAIRVLAEFAVRMICVVGADDRRVYNICEFWTESRMKVTPKFAEIQQTGFLGTTYTDYRKLALFVVREAIEWYNSLEDQEKDDMKNGLAMGRL